MMTLSIGHPNVAIVVPTWLERWVVLKAVRGAVRMRRSQPQVWNRGSTLILQSEMGPKSAARAVEWLQPLRLSRLWLLGVCGGLIDELKTGDVVLSDATFEAGGQRWTHRPPDQLVNRVREIVAGSQQRSIVGPVYSADQPLVTPEQKRMAAQSGAIAVEMEAGPLAAWAVSAGLPFVHLRVVLDPHDSFPLAWRRPAGFVFELAGFPFLRQMWRAGQVLRRLVAGLSQPGAPVEEACAS